MRHFAYIYFLIALAACQSSPTQVSESIAAGYITVESLAETALTAFNDGYIDEAQKNEIADLLQLAQNGLNIATEISDTSSTVEALTYVSTAYQYFQEVRGILDGSSSDN
jgi:hypothetical protein